MRAIVIKEFGGPEQLVIENLPDPQPKPDHIIVEVKAFGLNRAETYMRKGAWSEAAKVSGIECVGIVKSDASGELAPGQKVFAVMGGMGRSINGSYAELTQVPAANVVAIESNLSWAELAAIPESYATAWACLFGNLALKKGQTLLIRGATSPLGQAALNLAAFTGAEIIATTRKPERFEMLKQLGANKVVQESPELAGRLRELYPQGVDAVLELVGNSVLLGSLSTLRRHGRLCMAGFVGGLAPLTDFNPLLQMPSGVHFSFFGSFVFGMTEFPLSEIPLQTIVDRVTAGIYKAKPARVFCFEEIQEAHHLMDAYGADGKIVVTLEKAASRIAA
jgi:NADPH:quinone reductase-like Zn-dependent oxidoreductase